MLIPTPPVLEVFFTLGAWSILNTSCNKMLVACELKREKWFSIVGWCSSCLWWNSAISALHPVHSAQSSVQIELSYACVPGYSKCSQSRYFSKADFCLLTCTIFVICCVVFFGCN